MLTDIELKIDNQKFVLGTDLNVGWLIKNGFKKVGFITSLFMEKATANIIYWKKNPSISCFEKFILIPLLKGSSSETDFMFGTSSYIFFSENKISEIFFQLIGNKHCSKILTDSFVRIISEKFGKPNVESSTMTIWNFNDSILKCGISASSAYFIWTTQN